MKKQVLAASILIAIVLLAGTIFIIGTQSSSKNMNIYFLDELNKNRWDYTTTSDNDATFEITNDSLLNISLVSNWNFDTIFVFGSTNISLDISRLTILHFDYFSNEIDNTNVAFVMFSLKSFAFAIMHLNHSENNWVNISITQENLSSVWIRMDKGFDFKDVNLFGFIIEAQFPNLLSRQLLIKDFYVKNVISNN